MELSSRIFVAGHRGLIGSAVLRLLDASGYEKVIVRPRSALDLVNRDATKAFFSAQRPDYVVLAAGRVGGIQANRSLPADFLNENLAIQQNVFLAAHETGVKRLIFLGSSCMYPRECSQPMAESSLLTGPLEPTSIAYAMAKLVGVHACLAYNRQYGEHRFVPLIPNSTYGPGDNFDPASAHVVAALIARFHLARVEARDTVTLWGTGSPRRELIHADDVAAACIHFLSSELRGIELPVNVGVGRDYTIRELATLVAEVVGYRGSIAWDESKPDGAPRKLLCSDRALATGWAPRIEIRSGLESTYAWFLDNVAAAPGSYFAGEVTGDAG